MAAAFDVGLHAVTTQQVHGTADFLQHGHISRLKQLWLYFGRHAGIALCHENVLGDMAEPTCSPMVLSSAE